MPSLASDDRSAISRQILITILRHGPQLGAKLKVHLVAELGLRLQLPPYQYKTLIPKLSTFLAANSDLVEIERGPGDIVVSLRGNAPEATANETESPFSPF